MAENRVGSAMMNTKSLWALMAVISLILTAIGSVRFGIDLWNYFRAGAANTNVALNYRGMGGALSGAVMFTIFILLYFRAAPKGVQNDDH